MYVKVRIIGGLGNQLFQYATAFALAKKNNAELIIDVSDALKYQTHPYCLDRFECDGLFLKKTNFFQKIIFKIGFEKFVDHYYIEKDLSFNSELLKKDNNVSLFGYFQDERYFYEYKDVLKGMLVPKTQFTCDQINILNKIKSGSSVAVHVRRGDYLSDKTVNNVHGCCSKAYYYKAIERLKTSADIDERTEIFVFSDDIDWCRENLIFDLNTNYVFSCSDNPELDLLLMSKCKHFIISNSTFSWWSAWLCDFSDKKVIAPKKWFDDGRACTIQPDGWELI